MLFSQEFWPPKKARSLARARARVRNRRLATPGLVAARRVGRVAAMKVVDRTRMCRLVWLPLQSLAVNKHFFLCKFWAVKNF